MTASRDTIDHARHIEAAVRMRSEAQGRLLAAAISAPLRLLSRRDVGFVMAGVGLVAMALSGIILAVPR